MERKASAGGNGKDGRPRLAGWFMPEPLDPKVLRRILTLRAWRQRNAIIGGLIEVLGENGG